MKNKRGAMQLSFGMIFSIILIVVFIAFAFWGIKKFLDMNDCSKIGIFIDDVKEDIGKMWESTIGSQKISYSVPSDVKYVCFADMASPAKGLNQEKYSDFELKSGNNKNMFFYPLSSGCSLASVVIEHIDIDEITSSENPFCLQNVKGKISLTLKKEYGSSLVVIER